jgi:protein-disulfide isomerase
MHASLETAVNEGKIRWVYRDYPLSSIHPLGEKAAEAAQCAGAQEKFWEYTDALFAAQSRIGSWQDPDHELATLAEGIHADAAELEQCLESGEFRGVIQSEAGEAEALQIAATPTIFINNKRHEGSLSYEDLKKWLADHPS